MLYIDSLLLLKRGLQDRLENHRTPLQPLVDGFLTSSELYSQCEEAVKDAMIRHCLQYYSYSA